MKKIAKLVFVALLTVSFAGAFAGTTATTTPTAEDQAKEICTKQGLTGTAWDECVKKEVAKVSTAKPAIEKTAQPAPATQPSN